MQFKFSILLLLIVYLIAGCSNKPSELKYAEQLVETHPDSALFILQHLKPEKYKSPSDRALYNLLLFQAFDKTDQKMQPVSFIDFSIKYYQNKKDNLHLARCYYFKGHWYLNHQHYDEASVLYLKAINCLKYNDDFYLLGKIYANQGHILAIQRDYSESKKKYQLSLNCFRQLGNTNEINNIILCIGRSYRLQKNYKIAQRYFLLVLRQNKDSNLKGLIYQEIGINYYSAKQFDSAQFYIRLSLKYPYKGIDYSIRSYMLADMLFDKQQYDSSANYANIALEHPINFYTQRECYRILTNIEYIRKNIKQMGVYMSHYQDCADSVRQIESQTKLNLLEKLNNTTREAKHTKGSMLLLASVLGIFALICFYLFFYLYKRYKLKNEQMNIYKNQLHGKHEFVSHRLSKKIVETRALQAERRKNTTPEERAKLDREVYNIALYINNTDDFNRLMNQAFNNIVVNLKTNYPTITHKEITWCCLHLLEIPHTDRMLLLDSSSDSLYKLKQRLAHKLNLKTTKDLDAFLIDITEIKV